MIVEAPSETADAAPQGIVLPNGDAASVPPAPKPDPGRNLSEMITWSVAIWGLFLVSILLVALVAKAILVPLALGFVLAAALTPLTRRVRRLGLSQSWAAALIILALLAACALIAFAVLLPAWAVLGDLVEPLKEIGTRVRAWLVQLGINLSGRIDAGVAMGDKAASDSLQLAGSSLLALMPSLALTLTTALFLAYFILAFGNRFMTKLVRMLPTVHDKVGALRIVREVQRDLGRYLATVSLINFSLGIAVTLLTWWAGLPVPLFWGGFVAVINYLPYVGPTASLILVGLAGLCFLATPLDAMLVTAALALIFLIEGQILNPILVGQRLKLNPLVVFMAFLFWGWLWGIFGMLLAVPLLIVVKQFSVRFPGWKPVSSFLSR